MEGGRENENQGRLNVVNDVESVTTFSLEVEEGASCISYGTLQNYCKYDRTLSKIKHDLLGVCCADNEL